MAHPDPAAAGAAARRWKATGRRRRRSLLLAALLALAFGLGTVGLVNAVWPEGEILGAHDVPAFAPPAPPADDPGITEPPPDAGEAAVGILVPPADSDLDPFQVTTEPYPFLLLPGPLSGLPPGPVAGLGGTGGGGGSGGAGGTGRTGGTTAPGPLAAGGLPGFGQIPGDGGDTHEEHGTAGDGGGHTQVAGLPAAAGGAADQADATAAVPIAEPLALVSFAVGLAGLALAARRRPKAPCPSSDPAVIRRRGWSR